MFKPNTIGIHECKTDQISAEQLELVNLLPNVIREFKNANQSQNWVSLS